MLDPVGLASAVGRPIRPALIQLSYFSRLYTFLLFKLEDTARNAGLLLAPAEGLGLWPFGQKKSLLCCYGPFLTIFVSSCNLGNFVIISS